MMGLRRRLMAAAAKVAATGAVMAVKMAALMEVATVVVETAKVTAEVTAAGVAEVMVAQRRKSGQCREMHSDQSQAAYIG